MASACVSSNVLDAGAVLPEWAPFGRYQTYFLDWYEVRGKERGVVITTATWSGPTGVEPGERWGDVIRRARDNARRITKEMDRRHG